MRSLPRLLLIPALVGLALGSVALSASHAAAVSSPRVVIVDNDAPVPAQGIDLHTSEWGFAPAHITVTRGEIVTFYSPKGNKRPHGVVSLDRNGTAPTITWTVGTKFSSGLTAETYLRAEGSMLPSATGTADPSSTTPAPSSWNLDTSTLDPGIYTYLCPLHNWMVGTLMVLPAP